ncbi:MAG: TonB family protein [Draconibacterium sp.]|nr:TonB family protein [Draconibacterium sp.]
MMSKIKSSKLAITKITFGILVAATLVIAFACEQKESVEMEPVMEEQAMTFSVEDNQLRITGTSEELVKIKSFLSDNRKLDIVTDSNGVLLLEKKKFEYPKSLEDVSEIFFVVEDMPEFPGGDLELRKYIGKNVDYPEIAQKNGIQGKVYVTFVVTKNGDIANAAIARGVDSSLDQEALRVVNSLPKWKPGKQRGQAVNVSFTVPINFVLQK